MKKDYKKRLKDWRKFMNEILNSALFGHQMQVMRSAAPNIRIVAIRTREPVKTGQKDWLAKVAFSYSWWGEGPTSKWETVEYEEAIAAFRLHYSKRHRIPLNHLEWAEVDENFTH